MKVHSYIAAAALSVALASAGAFAQGETKSQAAPHSQAASANKATVTSHMARGKITSLDPTNLVIQRPGKAEKMSFVLDSKTVNTGKLSVGEDVMVRYHKRNTENLATAVQPAVRKKS